MKRVLSGLQPSGQLHLGNYAGAVRQFIEMQETHEMYIFVASYHSLTTMRDGEELRNNIRQVVIDYLAFGLDPEKTHIYLQQQIPEVTELCWILSCVCQMHMMDKATSYKDKVANGIPASVGLFSYPILQAADILIVNPDLVPVGKDQVQHVEITRDLAQRFNFLYCEKDKDDVVIDPVFKLPDYKLREAAGVVPGIDGRKMSKSYGNGIDPFMAEKPLRKRIMKITTDSTPMEDAKDPEVCTVYQIFRALAGDEDERTAELAERYRAGGMGYGHAKQALFELIMDHFGEARQKREQLMADPGYIESVLKQGADSARAQAAQVMSDVKQKVGLETFK